MAKNEKTSKKVASIASKLLHSPKTSKKIKSVAASALTQAKDKKLKNNIEAKKNIGIWMDHSAANFIDFHAKKNNCSIKSEFTYNVKKEALSRNENLMHNKEQQMHEAYYKEIADKILKYEHVLLFGPTNAKTELHNYLNKDLHFKDIKIEIESTDKMTDSEKNAFVLNYFNK